MPECQGTLCLKLNRRVFDYKLSDCGLESRCCHIRISSDESDKEDSDEKSPDQENSNKKFPITKRRLHNIFPKKKKL